MVNTKQELVASTVSLIQCTCPTLYPYYTESTSTCCIEHSIKVLLGCISLLTVEIESNEPHVFQLLNALQLNDPLIATIRAFLEVYYRVGKYNVWKSADSSKKKSSCARKSKIEREFIITPDAHKMKGVVDHISLCVQYLVRTDASRLGTDRILSVIVKSYFIVGAFQFFQVKALLYCIRLHLPWMRAFGVVELSHCYCHQHGQTDVK